jgi:hypothetical protein
MQPDGSVESASQNSAKSPSPYEVREQRYLWEEYTPFFSALFAPGKYSTDGVSGRQLLTRQFAGGLGPYFTDAQASAILEIPARGGQ